MRKRLALMVVAGLLAAGARHAVAQQDKGRNESTTRSVQGAVRDTENNTIDGAVVQLKDLKSLQVRSFITKGDGTFHFHGLNPNVDYELRADYQAFASDTKTLSSFDSRKVATINLAVKNKK